MSDDPKITSRPALVRRAIAAIIALASLGLWLVSSDVVRLIAEQEDVLLGRYSLEWFSALFFLTPLLWLVALLLALQIRWNRRAVFRALALGLSILMGLFVVDLAGRLTRSARYVEDAAHERTRWPGERVEGIVRTRPANVRYDISYADEPPVPRSYPHAPPGFPPVELTLTTDQRGFRNQTALDRYEIVALGDSFAEGSRVSDDERWPALVEGMLGLPVYNMGISGSSPRVYLNNFLAYAAELEAKVALFMFYEGNDFKVHRAEREVSGARSVLENTLEGMKNSPIVLALRRAFVERLGAIHADAPVPDAELLAWMPVAIQADGGTQHYAFRPKRLMRLYWTPSQFLASRGWLNTVEVIREIKQACERAGVRPVFVYAPSKPHVVMPLVRERVAAEPLRAFAALYEKGLPPALEFKRELYTRLDTQEFVLRTFCQREGIEFVSTTDILREQMARGVQVYYTYDQHWTKWGHVAVAQVVSGQLARSYPTPGPSSGSSPTHHATRPSD